jgi:hypothetical protein
MQKKAFKTIPLVAQNAAQPANVNATIHVANVKCSLLPAQAVVWKLKFLSVPQKTVRYTAATAMKKHVNLIREQNKKTALKKELFFYFVIAIPKYPQQ